MRSHRAVRIIGGMCFILLMLSQISANLQQIQPSGSAIRLALDSDPTSLDPTDYWRNYASSFVINQMYEGLFRYTPTGAIEPRGASIYDVSEDGLIYSITLRPNQWSDGEPVVAEDYYDALVRIGDPAAGLNGLARGLYLISGFQEYNEGGDLEDVGIDFINPDTLIITLDSPNVYFTHILASPTLFNPIRLDKIDLCDGPSSDPNDCVGNGPYQLLLWQEGESLTLAKNPYYWDVASVGIDEIILPIIPDLYEQLEVYQHGQLDVSGFPPEMYSFIESDPLLNEEFLKIQRSTTYYLGLNTIKTPTDNLNLRKALASAIDRQTLLDNVFETPWRLRATGLVPPGVLGYQGLDVGYEYDPVAADYYLSASGLDPSEIDLEIWYNDSPLNASVIATVAQMWQDELGITIQFKTWPDIYTHVDQLAFCAENPTDPDCTFHGYRMGFQTDVLDAWGILADSSDFVLQGTGWENATYNSYLLSAAGEEDEETRAGIYKDAETILVTDEAVVIPIYHYDRTVLIKPYVNYEYQPHGGAPDLMNWSIDALTVTNTNDSGPGSLRQAIEDANNESGEDLILFRIPGVGPHTIQPQSALPTITDPVIIDGYSQPGASPNTNPPGQGSNAVLKIELDGSDAVPNKNGLHISAGNSSVRGLAINQFGGVGIYLYSNGGNVIEGNFIGTDVSGSADLGNLESGVYIYKVSNNTIGGTSPAACNVISGNDRNGVRIFATSGEPARDNLIQGNLIGINASGDSAIGNSEDGVKITNAANNTVGGTEVGAGNVISGNVLNGVRIVAPAAIGNLVQGNYIGTNVAGDADIANGYAGVEIQNAPGNTIGGTISEARNIISGNKRGVFIASPDATDNFVEGNFIGTDVTGGQDLGNTEVGIWINVASDNTIGGTEPGAGNVISGNDGDGVVIASLPGFETSGNRVEGNYIGTDVTGAALMGNSGSGVSISIEASGNMIGGSSFGEGNVISGNGIFGVVISSSGNTVEGNMIGTDMTGSLPLGNEQAGVAIFDAANNHIGGDSPGQGNVISANVVEGVYIAGAAATGNYVQGNLIGTDASGTIDLGNAHALIIDSSASGNTIGGANPGARNVISGNDRSGVGINPGSTGNFVQGNYIGTDISGLVALGNTEHGVFLDASNNTIGGTIEGAGNLISSNGMAGIVVNIGRSGNKIQGNLIGTDVTGTQDLGNALEGVGIAEAFDNLIEANTIAFNRGDGVQVNGGLAVGNTISENSIHTNVGQGIANIAGGNSGYPSPTIAPILGQILTGTAPDALYVEIFADANGEGRLFLGYATIDDGVFIFDLPDPLTDPLLLPNITATATDGDGNTSEFSIPQPYVPDNCELNDNFETPCDVEEELGFGFSSEGSFQSFMSRPDDVDWFTFSLPQAVVPGSQVTINLSGIGGGDLPANFDLVVLAEASADPDTVPSPLQGVPLQGVPLQGVPLQGVPLQGVDAEGVPLQGVPLQGVDVNDIPLQGVPLQGVPLQGVPLQGVPLQGVPLQGVSFHQGRQPEEVSTLFRGGMTGVYYVLVWSSSGEYSVNPSNSPYEVTVTLEPVSAETCRTKLYQAQLGDPLDDPLSYDETPTTLILIHRPRMVALYDNNASSPTPTEALDTSLASLVPLIDGLLVDLGDEDYSLLDNAYEDWDANGCDPDLANIVTREIKKVILAILADHPTIENLVIVGNDTIIPFRRVADGVVRTPDGATVPNEYDYQGEENGTKFIGSVGTENSPTLATLRLQYYLSDDFYADLTPILLENGRELSIPDMPIGRLVETPEDIQAYIQAFIELGGMIGDGAPLTSLTTGYSFLIDQAGAILETFNLSPPDGKAFDVVNTPIDGLINDIWGRVDLLNEYMPMGDPPNSAPWISSINAHFDHARAASASYMVASDPGELFSTSDVLGASTDFAGTLLFTVGCHSGLNFFDEDVLTGYEAGALDWPQVLVGRGASLIGNWGFGYGDDAAIAYSEELMLNFARYLGVGNLGRALVEAKREYLLNQAELDPVHEKILMEAVFYGLPNWELTAPELEIDDGITVEEPSDPISHNGFTSIGYSLTVDGLNPETQPFLVPDRGYIYKLAGRTQAAVFHPIQPQSSFDVASNSSGDVAHGVLFIGGNFFEADPDNDGITNDFDPVITMPTWTRTSLEPQFIYEGWDPPRFWSLMQLERGDGSYEERLAIVPGQFLVDAAATQAGGFTIGTERLYDTMEFEVFYASKDAEFQPPIIGRVNASASPNPGVSFSVVVEDPPDVNGETSGVAMVVVTYTEAEGGTSWRNEELDQGTGLNIWEGELDITGAIDFFVQAVDGSGNVGMFAGGGYFKPVVVTVSGPSTAFEGQPVTFSVSHSLDDPTILWDFGDGFIAAGTDTVVHTFSWIDQFTVTARVFDAFGNMGQATSIIEVLPDPVSNPDEMLDRLDEGLDDLKQEITDLDDNAFKNKPTERRQDLLDKLDEVVSKFEGGELNGAIQKLKNDIRTKMDGCPPEADKNDWVTDCSAQYIPRALIDDIIAYLEALMWMANPY